MEEVTNQELKELLEKNLETNQEILDRMKKVNSYIAWQNVWLVVKVFLIVVPIIISLVYLPPLLKDVFGSYQELLNPTTIK